MSKIILFLLLIPSIIFSQKTLKATIQDFETKQPIIGANIFVSNTTFGTVSNTIGYFEIPVSSSKDELIISYLGYESVKIDLNTISDFNTSKTIYLHKSSTDLKEVIIHPSKSKNRVNNLNTFKVLFIGKSELASKTKILNENKIQFTENNENGTYQLIAYSNVPIQIINKKLGYKINYELVDFEYKHEDTHEKSFSYYSGYAQFIDIIDEYHLNKKEVLENRKKAYYGSPMHFIRSVYLRNYNAEGFVITNFIREPNPKYPDEATINQMRKDKNSLFAKLPDKYIITKSNKNTFPDELIKVENDKTFIGFDNYISVIYRKEAEEDNYALNYRTDKNPFQTSEIKLKDSKVEIFANGNSASLEKIIFYGHMSWEKMGDMLPFDYQP